MEQAAAQLAQDNCELACCFIQKTAVEKAGPEMDKRLATVSALGMGSSERNHSLCPSPPSSLHLWGFCVCLWQEFELRKHARQEGRRYCDPVVLTYQAERMPEQIRLKVREPEKKRGLPCVLGIGWDSHVGFVGHFFHQPMITEP